MSDLKNLKSYIAIFAIIPVLFYFWPSFLGGDTEFMSVTGESMLPTIKDGSLAILKKDSAYNKGDIVAYYASEMGLTKTVIHRIVGESGQDNFILKGDNNRSNDPEPVKPNKIIGKLLFHIPYVGYLPLLMKNPLVLVLTMMGLAFIAMIDKKRHKKNPEVRDAEPISKPIQKRKEAKKIRKQISLFIPALVLNFAYYMFGQYSIYVGTLPNDGYTAFLTGIFDPYLASTIVFSTWFGAIMGSYIISRYSISLEYRKSANVARGTVQMNYHRLVSFKIIAQLFWMIYIGVYLIFTFITVIDLV